MERHISMEEISDGRRYHRNDMVKAGCNDCKGCSACCKNMGESIVLDPYDIYQLQKGLSMTFEELLAHGKIELNVVEGVILPNIAMHENCGFLNEEGRCSIHPYRPGICRLFPLGRWYEEGDFSYFLQVHECKNTSRTKVKVKNWIDIDNVSAYEAYICKWHYFLKDISAFVLHQANQKTVSNVNQYLLHLFFQKPYDVEQDFYQEFEKRYEVIQSAL